jgi:hypothetical protein
LRTSSILKLRSATVAESALMLASTRRAYTLNSRKKSVLESITGGTRASRFESGVQNSHQGGATPAVGIGQALYLVEDLRAAITLYVTER